MPLTFITFLKIIFFPIYLMWKIGVRRFFVWGYLITTITLGLIHSIRNANMWYLLYDLGNALIRCDNMIVTMINNISNLGTLSITTFFTLCYYVWSALGSLFFIWFFYHDILYDKVASKFTDAEASVFLIWLLLLMPLVFFLKLIVFVALGNQVGNNLMFYDKEVLINAIPFNFLIVLVSNFDKIINLFEPIISTAKNITSSSVYKNITGINITNTTGA